MAALLLDRVLETTTTTGTGTVNLAGAQTGYNAFRDEADDGATVYYLIVNDPSSPTAWEYGLGTLTYGTPDTLSRDTVIASSNSGSKITIASGSAYTVLSPGGRDALQPGSAAKTSAYTLTMTDIGTFFSCDASSAGFTVTLPAAATATGRYWAIVANTGASNDVTIDADGSEVINGATTLVLRPGDVAYLRCDGSEWGAVASVNVSEEVASEIPAYIPGYRHGLKLSNSSGDSDHDIDIATGLATADDDSAVIQLSSALTKRIDAAWAVGTGNGGLDTGSVTTETWYHVWLIRRSDTGVVDALFSTSSTAPTMPTNYDEKAHIGAVYTDASSNILPFYQMGDWFMWTSESSLAVKSDTLTAQTAKLFTLLTPSGFDTEAQLNFYAIPDGSTSAKIIIQHPEAVVGSAIPGTGGYPIADTFPTSNGGEAGGPKRQFVDSSSQVRVRSAAGSPRTTSVNIQVIAWRIIY